MAQARHSGTAGPPGSLQFMASSRSMPGAALPIRKPLTAPRLLGLIAVAAGLHLAVDGLSWLVPGTAPPHLLLRYGPDFAREMVGPLGMSIAACAIWGIVGVIALLAIEPIGGGPARRARVLAATLWGFWLLSEGLMALVWLDAPWGLVVGGLLAGIPRSAAVAWALVWMERRRGAP